MMGDLKMVRYLHLVEIKVDHQTLELVLELVEKMVRNLAENLSLRFHVGAMKFPRGFCKEFIQKHQSLDRLD